MFLLFTNNAKKRWKCPLEYCTTLRPSTSQKSQAVSAGSQIHVSPLFLYGLVGRHYLFKLCFSSLCNKRQALNFNAKQWHQLTKFGNGQEYPTFIILVLIWVKLLCLGPKRCLQE